MTPSDAACRRHVGEAAWDETGAPADAARRSPERVPRAAVPTTYAEYETAEMLADESFDRAFTSFMGNDIGRRAEPRLDDQRRVISATVHEATASTSISTPIPSPLGHCDRAIAVEHERLCDVAVEIAIGRADVARQVASVERGDRKVHRAIDAEVEHAADPRADAGGGALVDDLTSGPYATDAAGLDVDHVGRAEVTGQSQVGHRSDRLVEADRGGRARSASTPWSSHASGSSGCSMRPRPSSSSSSQRRVVTGVAAVGVDPQIDAVTDRATHDAV